MLEDHTYGERCKAQIIMRGLRNSYSRKDVSEIMGIKLVYVSFIENMNKRNVRGVPLSYIAPIEVIRHVINWGKRK